MLTDRIRSGRNPERGIALLAVVAVLVLLTIIATPFLVTMKDGAERGKALLASSEAALEAENVIQVATLYLGASHDALERKAEQEKLQVRSNTPDWDTLEEIQLPSSLLAAAGGDPEGGRIWGVTVEDESGKINVNTAPFTTLGHFFGMSLLASPLEMDSTEAEIQYPGNLPARNGVIRIGDEVVRYDRLEGTMLRGLQRGYMAGTGPCNGPAVAHKVDDIVVNEVAFQISAYPILARRGVVDGEKRTWYVPYRNLYEIRRIGDLGVAALTADDWERVADSLTVSSRGLAGHPFGDPQTLRNTVKAGEDGHKAVLRVDNPFRFSIGTTVRVTDGTHVDYAVVFGVGGTGGTVEVVPELQYDYDADVTRVESLLRTPVNINTASREVLTALHSGLRRHGQKSLGADQAKIVADSIIKERAAQEADSFSGQKASLPGIGTLKQYKDLVRKLVDEGKILSEEATACELNALNPSDTAPGRLAVGSMPVGFRSSDVFTVTARAVILDTAGRELGRREFRRVVDVAPQGPAVFELAGQADLDENLRTVNAKHFTTYPTNIARDETGIYPPSRFSALFRSDRWPSRDRADPLASVRYEASRPVFGPEVPQPEHYDDSDYSAGYYMEEGEAPPFATDDSRVAVKGGSGLEPFSASLWFKPYWGGKRTAYVFDSGESENEDRFSLYYDGGSRDLVFRVKDTSLQSIAAEIRYPFDESTWEDDRWYHLLVSASGGGPGQMTMLVDGASRGKPTLLTYLSQSVDSTATVNALAVEDASSFPASGAVLVRGSDGVEVFEYSSRTETALTIRKRFARYNRADTTDDVQKATTRAFQAGDLVTLYGYSIPTASAIPEGSGTLASALGKFTAICIKGPSDTSGLEPYPQSTGGTAGGGGSLPPVAYGWRGLTIQLPLDQVAPWGGDAGDPAAFDALSSRGYALLASGDHRGGLRLNGDVRIFDAELVTYEKSGGSVTITRQPEPTAHLTFSGGGSNIATLDKKGAGVSPSFVPRHTYGDDSDPMTVFLKQENINNGRIYADETIDKGGIISVLIPISIEVAGGDEEMFLDPETDPGILPMTGFVQVGTDGDSEWIRFDDAVADPEGSNLLLVRDRSATRTVSLFRTWAGDIAVTSDGTPPPGDPPPPPPGGGDTPPPVGPPEDDGGGGGLPDPDEPPPPPPDSGGGEDDGPGGTPDTPPVPPDPGTGEDDGPGGAPDEPPPPGDDGSGEDDGPGGDPDEPPAPPEDPTPPEDDGGGGAPDTPPDTPPTPPDDGGTTPPDDGGTTDPDPDVPPPPSPGPGGTTGSGSTIVPFPMDRIARYLDMRSTATTGDPIDPTATDAPIYIADFPVRSLHSAGAQVLPVFLAAFPGTEYDPQGNGAYDPQSGLDDILNVPLGTPSTGTSGTGTSGGSTAGGGGSTAGSPAGSTGGSGATASATENLWKPGDTGDGAEPGSSNVDGRFIEPGPGEDDIVTVVQGGTEGEKETQVINWSFRQYGWNRAGTVQKNWTFVAFKQPVGRTFERNSRSFDEADVNAYLQGLLGDRRSFTRLVKSPSGELPVRVAANIHVGADYNGGNFAPAVVDEVQFTSPRSAAAMATRSTWFTGSFAAPAAPGKGVTAGDVNIGLHAAAAFQVQTWAAGLHSTGGLVRIGDELVGYSSFDESTQTLLNCERGALGTEARDHSYGAPIVPVLGVGATRLEEGLGETSPDVSLASAQGFPLWGGFVRIGNEVLGYTRVDGNVLKMPRAVSRSEDTWTTPGGSDASKGLLRARFGTEAAAHEAQAMVYLLPHRFADLAAESADNPQLAWYTVSRRVQGAVWKRVSWDERLRELNGIRVLVRFEGGPDWDTTKIVRLGTDPVPDTGRTGYLYEVRSPRDLNLINVQSDSIECRVFFTYEAGAFDMNAASAPDAWKETPWLQAFRIEYAAPSGVVTTEDLR